MKQLSTMALIVGAGLVFYGAIALGIALLFKLDVSDVMAWMAAAGVIICNTNIRTLADAINEGSKVE